MNLIQSSDGIRNFLLGVFLLLILLLASIFGLLKHHQWLLAATGALFLALGTVKQFWQNSSEQADEKNRLLIDTLAISIPVALLWILYGTVSNAWWMNDDPAILKSILQNGIFAHFYEPEIWQQFNTANLTPWVQLSLGLDLHLFGLNPSGFYLHHLLSFSAVIILGYLVLRLFFPPLISSFILSFFVASVPAAATAQFLMVRHYLEGLGLSCAAFWFYVKAFRSEKSRWALAGSLFYLLACTTKEIYVPLIAVLFFFPTGSIRQRLKNIAPFALIAGSYVVWRAYMLGPGNVLSGYGDVHGKPGLREIINLPRLMATIIGWNSWWYLLILALAISPFLFGLIKDGLMRTGFFSIVLAMVCMVPIIPVIPILTERYLFLPVFIASLAIGAGLEFHRRRLWKGGFGYLFVLLMFLSLLVPVLNTTEKYYWSGRQATELFRITGKFVLYDGDETDVFINPPAPAWFYNSFLWIRENALILKPGPKICYDLCTCKIENLHSAYQYKNGAMEKTDLSETKDKIDCGNESADLTVDMYFSSDALHWKFGPYTQGQYYFSGSSEGVYISGFFLSLPPEGRFPIKLPEQLNFVIKYISSEGWRTYSPVLTIDRNDMEEKGTREFHWKRPQWNGQ